MNRIFVVNAKHLMVGGVIVLLLVSICLAGNLLVDNTIETSTGNRLLPIYSVETDQKEVALTFDCAWRCR